MCSSRGRVREWRAEVSRSAQSRLNRQSRCLAFRRPSCLLRYRCPWPLVKSTRIALYCVQNCGSPLTWRQANECDCRATDCLLSIERYRLGKVELDIWIVLLDHKLNDSRSRVGSASGAQTLGYPAPSWCFLHALGSVDLVMSSRTFYDYNLAFDEPVVVNWSIAQPVWGTLIVSLNSAPL